MDILSNEISQALQIRYVKLHFLLQITEDCQLPYYKASAIRGGIGEMLLRANCIRDRRCEACDFRGECIVQRTMYSIIDNKPDYVTTGESVGYVIECEDNHEDFCVGDTLEFNLILFGKNIVYFNQYMLAVYALGQNGLGSENARFSVISVSNAYLEPILDGANIYMEKYKISTLKDYVEYRLGKMMKEGDLEDIDGSNVAVSFRTPFTTKYKGEFIKELNPDALIASISRRLEVLDAFENIDGSIWKRIVQDVRNSMEFSDGGNYRVLKNEEVSIRRFSFRKGQAMHLKGIKGRMIIYNLPIDAIVMLIVAEIIHAGKNTSFGFGRVQVHIE